MELIDLANDLTQMVNFPTWISVLLFWIYLFLLMLVSVLQWLPLHWEIHVSVSHNNISQFPLTFHHIHDGMPHFIWLFTPCDHLKDAPWKDIFKISGSPAAREFFEWLQVGIDVSVPHWKYQIKPHSSRWFSTACAVAIVHRNHFFQGSF